jgi:hypothetical protein
MTGVLQPRTRWLVVVAFAIGMAWIESATVYYLRVFLDRINPYQANPLPNWGVLGQVELVREAGTLVMLLAVGALAGRTWHTRLAYTAIAFGVWDIFYYAFLRLMAPWPLSLLDWDILFLLPLPWWGPVIAPASIAALLVVWGTLATRADFAHQSAVEKLLWRLNWIGMTLALYVFMADALRDLRLGLDVTKTLPTTFNWPLFFLAYALMAAPVAHLAWRLRTSTFLIRGASPVSD